MFPDFNQWLGTTWGFGDEGYANIAFFCGASNIAIGTNQPYAFTDFFALHSKFAGKPSDVEVTLVSGSAQVQPSDTGDFENGDWVTGPGIPTGTLIQSVDSATQFTMTAAATSSGTWNIKLYNEPLLPIFVINCYITLASASLMQVRWQEMWPIAMGLYISHFVTLWLQSDGASGGEYGTAQQAASAGLAQGITVSKSAGPVSKGMQPTPGLEDWGQWNLTSYGQIFASYAKTVGMGPMLLW